MLIMHLSQDNFFLIMQHRQSYPSKQTNVLIAKSAPCHYGKNESFAVNSAVQPLLKNTIPEDLLSAQPDGKFADKYEAFYGSI